MWWSIWGDQEDERNPAPFLCALWILGRALDNAWFWFWRKKLWPLSKALWDLRLKLFPRPILQRLDEDGLAPEHHLLIAIYGLWNMYQHDNRFDYDQSIKKKWDEFLNGREADHTDKPAS
ncbi:MAG TPA: hypothetical protein VG028_21240 [Terriglobia bacterium]|nr:hypothetical protein [Terriglobia bacterium]